jgi:uncharacterized protein (DUF305 family)
MNLRVVVISSLLAAAAAACHTTAPGAKPSTGGGDQPALIQPGAPGQAGHTVAPEKAADVSHVQATKADIEFMQGMIHHHAQAVEMTDLLETRTQSEDMKKLALRISLSQVDEIGMMQNWLRARGQTAPDPLEHRNMHHEGMDMSGMDMSSGPMMPGMLTPEQMKQLAAAKGPEFDRLFLEGMIRHHDGALVMVKNLFATPGAAQDSEIFAFASDVDADQRMEIERMGRMLKELEK